MISYVHVQCSALLIAHTQYMYILGVFLSSSPSSYCAPRVMKFYILEL